MIGLGADHNGYVLKERIRDFLEVSGHPVRDFGAYTGEPVDYPLIAARVAEAVAAGVVERAVLVCGTGLGMAIAANKVPGVFAVTVGDTYTARLARESNDANVLALGARQIGGGPGLRSGRGLAHRRVPRGQLRPQARPDPALSSAVTARLRSLEVV